MEFHYDKTTDSLYITLAPGGSVESDEISEDLIVDYNESGHVVGLDIQHASKRFDLTSIHVEGGSRQSDFPISPLSPSC